MRLLLGVALALLPICMGQVSTFQHKTSIQLEPPKYTGNEACARCHAAIDQSYEKTSMAHASGPAAEGFLPADFVHKSSGVHYRIYKEDGRVWLGFERPGEAASQHKFELLYYIGSGRRGLTYLLPIDGFLFESPINWYADKKIWDTAPAYQEAKEVPLNLPAFTSCLHCHVSEAPAPIDGTENRYPMPLLRHAGITCERCHGPGSAHLVGGPIVNPAKLGPERRDAVCMQCHLEGKAAIERPGHHLYEYRPGDNLSDYVRYFVLAGAQDSTLGAVSQVEALTQSACKKKSGDAMSCTSCHDPHSEPSPAERVSYYRTKCLACHSGLAAKHHPDQPDCTSCHMPPSLSKDVAHTQVTDHRIPRRPSLAPELLRNAGGRETLPKLVRFSSSEEVQSEVRDLALAWESLAESGLTEARSEAESRLRTAAAQFPDDPAILSGLAYNEQQQGKLDHARELYERALARDPNLIDAAANLGVIEARAGRLNHAEKLWQDAFKRAPARSRIGMNLVRVYCATGRLDSARTVVLRVLEFNPDLSSAKEMLKHLGQIPAGCGI